MEKKEAEDNVESSWQELAFKDKERELSPPTFVDSKILRMMKMMGYHSGLGLGKNNQGIIQPVTIDTQFQREGFGLKVENGRNISETWDFSLDDPSPTEQVVWLYCNEMLVVDINDITCPKEEKSNINIEEEYNFCDKEILHDVIAAKNIFDELDLKDLCQARGRANPFETVRSVFFMNRASLKIANIDAATGFMFSNIDKNPHHKDNTGPYYFADVCAGPGGFTEYILWRRKWHFKGFGFTLRGENDFKLTDSVCTSPVTFLPLYGACGDGNVCCPKNIDDFTDKVLFETENKGVHFMMSDGGFSVEGNENLQEILSKNIYICQCLMSLEILRKHGHFVTKVFDMFTCFSVGLLYLMSKCFEKVCILKPNTSRPANSERYIICSNYKGRENVQIIRTYLRKLVDRLWEMKNGADSNFDITEIVPLSILKRDQKFYSYIFNSNNRIAKNQTINLQKLVTFYRNPLLIDHRQEELRKRCLEYWQIPDKPKVPVSKYVVEDLLEETLHNRELLFVQSRKISCLADFKEIGEHLEEWHYVPMQCRENTNICNFYAGVGFSKVYRLQYNKWVRVKNLQLIRGTLLYGELVKEKYYAKDSSDQPQYKYSLHVIDALRLGDLNLADLDFEQRKNLIQLYCKAVNHEFRTNTIRIRYKCANELLSLTQNLCVSKDKTGESFITPLPVLGYKVKEECYEVNSILFFKTNNGNISLFTHHMFYGYSSL
ncbi:cap-specific mRNA (nucleoside-2'-O-)-methyltransferase 1 isoform X2 [Zophobas morio]|uniref:cap-specific mRNA (nucleoside-2'-O-)-methyltransferase 1 isoform X2 n=1 Tax=Zophobas morio TaxID=2755281 RepID=UPI003083BAE3